MAISNGTYLEDLVNPEVMADMIDKKLFNYIRFLPLATVDTTLQGRPGSVVSLPHFNLLGSAVTVAEGEDIPISQLTASTVDVSIHKIAIGAQITDESILSGYGDPFGEITSQEAQAIADGVDNEFLAILEDIGATMTYSAAASAIAPVDVNGALELFGEDLDGVKVLLVAPATHTVLRNAKEWLPASEIAAGIMIRGAVGEIFGCQVIVTNKLKDKGEAFIVKPGALRLFTKRDTIVETERMSRNKSWLITADRHFAPYMYDETKAVKIAV